jgi:CDP-diacylglycerol---serine O-phosphatidyltransferase
MKQIPNLFTLMNLLFGCAAIVLALQTDTIVIYANDDLTSSFNIPEKIALAALLLYAAALVDFLDGFVARLLKQGSEMGKQLDSLSDVISFGVAPGVLFFQLLRMSYMREENGLDVSIFLLFPAFIFSAAAAYRLAKFNLDTTQQYGFKGVPTPAAGLLVASLPLMLHYGTGIPAVNEWVINKYVLYGLIVVLSWLMVSNLPLMALKFKDYSFGNNKSKYLLAALALVSAIFLHWLAVPIVFIAYIILSLATKTNNA